VDEDEARLLALHHLNLRRGRTYRELLALCDRPERFEARGPSGKIYSVEIEAYPDDGRRGDLRVIAAVDDGSLMASLSPLCEDFIVRPDGSFVGEGD